MNIKAIIEEKLSIFSDLYDEMQVFGPLVKKEDSKTFIYNMPKINCCKKNKCENCTTIRAIKENHTVTKYEEYDGRIAYVTATPTEINGEKYIVELIRYLNKEDFQYLGVFENSIIKEISNLNYKIMHDKLTGIFNRRYIEEQIPRYVDKALKKSNSISMIMCDIDHFKNINDLYGHQIGDKVLCILTDIMKKETENIDSRIARYGGEEFIIVLPGKSKEESSTLVENIRKAFEKKNICIEDKCIKATASFGVVTKEKSNNIDIKEMIKVADENLYKAKDAGRNCVVTI